MAYGIVIVEVPKSCKECKFRECTWVDYCRINTRTITGIEPYEKRPIICPIRNIPTKRKLTYNDLSKDSEISGWNECIDEIMKTKKSD